MNLDELRLTPEQLSRRCDPKKFDFDNTSRLTTERTIYGQPRGVRAIEFGIDIQSPGYNIYVLGPAGSGRVSAIRQFIDAQAKTARTADDWCYVHNFKQPHKPRAIRMPAGQGIKLCRDMEALINTLREEIPRMLEGEVYLNARSEISNRYNTEREKILEQVQHLAGEMSLSIQNSPQGSIVIIPMHEGKPIPQEEFDKLTEDERTRISSNRRKLEESIDIAFRQSRLLQNEMEAALDGLRREIAQQVVNAHLREVLVRHDLVGAVINYLWEVRDNILDSLDLFEDSDEETANNMETLLQKPEVEKFRRYEINVLVENEPHRGAPVVVLDLPSYQNLVGRIEHEMRFGVLSTDFTQIKAGGLHRANGGFLLIRALDVFQQPFAWEALKRALNTNQAVIEDPESRNITVMATQQLEPEPIPLDLKVVLVGPADLYYGLYDMDDDFQDLFRVKADFGETMFRTEDAEMNYATFIATHCEREKMPHFDASAVARIIDYGSWMVADQRKLSTQFGQILPLVREAAYYARKNEHTIVTADDVQMAVDERIYRNNELEELSHERIQDGTIFIDVDGVEVGQINGLVIMDLGDHGFGLPARITARVYMGRDNVVQIDRESEMTGPIHDKGVMILEGYLGGMYAQDYPLTVTATLTFEQNYGGVEGDSAASAELYALLSALSGFPIRQDLGVTGSVNQMGKIQPIGGVTEKIEGFYKACQTRGLTGQQGVIIPKANLPELMLNNNVVDAVEKGEFHVYAISTIDEGIALLTDKSAEEVHKTVDSRLRDLAEKLVAFEDTSSDHDEEEDDDQVEEGGEE